MGRPGFEPRTQKATAGYYLAHTRDTLERLVRHQGGAVHSFSALTLGLVTAVAVLVSNPVASERTVRRPATVQCRVRAPRSHPE